MTPAEQARSLWEAAVAAVDPRRLVREELAGPLAEKIRKAERVLVVGGGKAGAAMAMGVEDALADILDRVEGLVNVPEGASAPLRRIQLHVARPAGSNFPTEEGVLGSERMLSLLRTAGPNDVALCLISGGGSALMPAPVDGVSLADKLATTKLLHACGASIGEMNAVRKHLSRIKGGGLAAALDSKPLISLIVSDVVGDPLDVIASGPTASDPTTFADAIEVLARYSILERVPTSIRSHLKIGAEGGLPETQKSVTNVVNRVIGSNWKALTAAAKRASELDYRVLNLGTFMEGETRTMACGFAGLIRSIHRECSPLSRPCCIIAGGETTVTLGDNPGKGGRNQEFVLAALHFLGTQDGLGATILSAGTDGEDGPTDAAGVVAGVDAIIRARELGLDPREYLDRHDAYTFFDKTGHLIRSGLTGTNVMDVVVILTNWPWATKISLHSCHNLQSLP